MNIIIDTGPIVALLDENDAHHEFADQKVRELKPPFYTCEAVLTESFFLMQRTLQGTEKLISLLATDKIKVTFSYAEYALHVREIIQTYANLPASFADACLVSMYENIFEARIFTLDTDFSIYRAQAGDPLSLISPNA